MIGKVCRRGSDVRRLLGYLFREGRAGAAGLASDHVDPRLVGGWDPELVLTPPRTEHGGVDLRHLAGLLSAPLTLAQVDPAGGPVYHLAVSAAKHPRTGALLDPLLSDAQWADIAATYLDQIGLAPDGDPNGVRWVAVRHAEDHIHVVVTLARQDGRRVWPHRDYHHSRHASHLVEARYGLTPTAGTPTRTHVGRTAGKTAGKAARNGTDAHSRAGKASGETAGKTTGEGTGAQVLAGEGLEGGHAPRPNRGEQRRYSRDVQQAGALGQRPPAGPDRDLLRRAVRTAAAATGDLPAFLARLHADSVEVRLRYSTTTAGQVTGYAVALPPAPGRPGQPERPTVWFGGGKLAPDLTLPQLHTRWARTSTATSSADTPSLPWLGQRGVTWRESAATARSLAPHLRPHGDPATAEAAGAAAADLLAAAAHHLEGHQGGPLTSASDALDAATRNDRRRHRRTATITTASRVAAALLDPTARPRGEQTELRDLLRALTHLAHSVARLQAAQGHLTQAHAAVTAVAALHQAATAQLPGPPRPALQRHPAARSSHPPRAPGADAPRSRPS